MLKTSLKVAHLAQKFGNDKAAKKLAAINKAGSYHNKGKPKVYLLVAILVLLFRRVFKGKVNLDRFYEADFFQSNKQK